MPVIPILMYLAIGGGLGTVAGFVAGKGVEGTGNLVKYAVIGTAGFVILKQMKVI